MNVMIVGGGKVGRYLATLLVKEHRVTIIEACGERIAQIQEEAPRTTVIHGSGTDPVLLESAGIRQIEVIAAATGHDEVNLVVTSLARFEFNVPRTMARVNDPRHLWMFTPVMGVDVALNQADLLAHLIAEELSLGDMVTLLKLHKGQYSLVEERVGKTARAVGKPLAALHLPTECVLAAVMREGALLIPKPDLVLRPNDEVLAVVHEEAVGQFATLLGERVQP